MTFTLQRTVKSPRRFTSSMYEPISAALTLLSYEVMPLVILAMREFISRMVSSCGGTVM